MAFPIRHLILCCLGVCISPPIHGQTPAVPPLTLKFTAYSINVPSEQIFYLPRAESAAKPIQFYTSAKSAAQNYTGPNPITFFHEAPSIEPTQPPSRKVLARAQVPSGITEPLFLFFPNPEFTKTPNSLPYLVYAFDDSTAKLPTGHVALINASGMEFVGQFNTEIITLSPGLNEPIKVGSSARIELRTAVRGRFYQSYQSTHSFAPNERALILLLPPLHPGSIEAQVRILRSEIEVPVKN